MVLVSVARLSKFDLGAKLPDLCYLIVVVDFELRQLPQLVWFASSSDLLSPFLGQCNFSWWRPLRLLREHPNDHEALGGRDDVGGSGDT